MPRKRKSSKNRTILTAVAALIVVAATIGAIWLLQTGNFDTRQQASGENIPRNAITNATLPVYAFYKNVHDHFYTISQSEAQYLSSQPGDFALQGYPFLGFISNEGDPRLAPVYRLYRQSDDDHFYTISEWEKQNAVANGYRDEGIGFFAYPSDISNTGINGYSYQFPAFYAYEEAGEDRVAVHRYRALNFANHFYAAEGSSDYQLAESRTDYAHDGIAFYVPATQVEGSKQVYHLLSSEYTDHLFTISEQEARGAGPSYRNPTRAFFAFDYEAEGTKPVHRLFYHGANDDRNHFYTMSITELEQLEPNESDRILVEPVYRLFNSTELNHIYTASQSEKQQIINNNGYVEEGVAFYAPRKDLYFNRDLVEWSNR